MRLVIASLAVAASVACATNPATGKKNFNLMSEAEEQAVGRQADAEIRREMGVYDDPQLQRYVTDVGLRLAARSHRPRLPWTFTIVDSPAINAFALPGGYVYITRGILPYLDDESELAGVLGHEIGHVTARHAAQQYSKAMSGGIGLTILSIFVPQTAPFADLSSTGLSLLFLKYSRDAELEADRLGVEYAADTGWDPTGVPRFLTTLSRVSALSERGVPNWLSTHPQPEARVSGAEPVAAKFISATATERNRDQYIEQVNGVTVGDNPQDGVVRGNVFLHPMMRIGLEFPEGWDVVNSEASVMAREPGTDHYMLLQQVAQPRGKTLEDVARAAMRSAGYTEIEGGSDRLSGMNAYVGVYRGKVRDVGAVRMRAAHVEMGRQVFVVAGFAPDKEFDHVDALVQPAITSFRELTRDEAARIRPNRLGTYEVKAGDSWQSIAVRAGKSLVSANTLAIMNDHEVFDQPQAGERIKIVIEG
jgi:predicted Zn-dependent protease